MSVNPSTSSSVATGPNLEELERQLQQNIDATKAHEVVVGAEITRLREAGRMPKENISTANLSQRELNVVVDMWRKSLELNKEAEQLGQSIKERKLENRMEEWNLLGVSSDRLTKLRERILNARKGEASSQLEKP
ncbi:MAG: hypothetical protein P4L16_05890 [Chlamydiales bacterium]|nr:hypothetical protein [Chlamydiales bacterium]